MHKKKDHETLALGEDNIKNLQKSLLRCRFPKLVLWTPEFSKVDVLFRIFCVCPLEKVVTQLRHDTSRNRITFLFQNITVLPEREFQMKNLNGGMWESMVITPDENCFLKENYRKFRIQAIAGRLVKCINATFQAVWGIETPQVFLKGGCCLGLLDSWILKANLLDGFHHKDLAIKISFRGNSHLPFCICFLKMCVAMPRLWCFFKVTPFSIVYCL
jgi:hypothetical protein